MLYERATSPTSWLMALLSNTLAGSSFTYEAIGGIRRRLLEILPVLFYLASVWHQPATQLGA